MEELHGVKRHIRLGERVRLGQAAQTLLGRLPAAGAAEDGELLHGAVEHGVVGARLVHPTKSDLLQSRSRLWHYNGDPRLLSGLWCCAIG